MAYTHEVAPLSMFGRNHERHVLLEAFHQAARGEPTMVLLGGESGVGKTSLVESIRDEVELRNGELLTGKFNQYNQHTPLLAWRHVVRELAQKIATERDERTDWLHQIRSAVGDHGQLLIDLVPEFEEILGKQPKLKALSPNEAKNRFLDTLESFFQSVCRPETPIAIFIDDIHWSDSWSVELMERVATQPFVLTICSYRSDEIEDAHVLFSTAEALKTRGVAVHRIGLAALDDGASLELLEGMLGGSSRQFSAELLRIANGNPFLLTELGKFISIAADASVSIHDLPSDATALMKARVHALDTDAQAMLRLASCLGHEFDVDTLALVSGLNASQCRKRLELCGGLVLPVGEPTGRRYRFFHDRVQQAAYAGMDDCQRARTHRRIVETLMTELDAAALAQRVCDVADHYSACVELLDDTERVKSAALQLDAAARVSEAGAYGAALSYHRAAELALSGASADSDELWSRHHELMKRHRVAHAETEFLAGNSDRAEQLLREAFSRADDIFDGVDSLIVLIKQRTLSARYADAIEVGREALDALGLPLPDEHLESARDRALERARASRPGSITDLPSLPAATDPTIAAAARVLIAIGPPCYRSNQALWSVFVPRVVASIQEHGLLPQAMYALPAYTGLLHWMSEPEGAFEYTDAAIEIANQSWIPDAARTVLWLMVGSSARHWAAPLSTATADYERAANLGKASGNLQYAAYALGHNVYCRFFAGADLRTLEGEVLEAREFAKARRNRWAVDLTEGAGQVISRLRQGTWTEGWSEEAFLARCASHGNEQVSCIYSVMMAQASAIQGDWAAALNYSERAEGLIHTVGTQGLLPWAEHVFVSGLVRGVTSQEPPATTPFERALGLVSSWTIRNPDLFLHKELILRAEIARSEGELLEAAELYERAQREAMDAGFSQWGSFANRRASSLFAGGLDASLESNYFGRAFEGIADWGAFAVREEMVATYRAGVEATAQTLRGSEESRARFVNARVREFETRAEHAESWRVVNRKLEIAEELATATGRLRREVAGKQRQNVALRRSKRAQEAINLELETLVEHRTTELRNLAAIVDGSTDAIIGLDLDGIVRSWNAAAEELLGFSKAEAVGRKVHELIVSPDEREREFSRIARVGLDGGRPYDGIRYRKDGSAFRASISLSPVWGSDGSVVGCSKIVRDVTEERERAAELRNKTEELLELNAVLERSNRDLEQFAYVVSHDLKEPIRMVASFTELLGVRYGDQIDEQGARYIRRSREGALRMQRLVSDLLEYSRLGARAIELEPVDLNEVANEALSNLEATIEDAGATVEVRPLGASRGHHGMLVQLLQNLIGNGIKFRRPDSPPHVVVEGEERGSGYVIWVHDNGLGIEPEHQERVFQMFQRLNRREDYPGNGVGLAIARRVVEVHQGAIEIESRSTGGTSFRVTLGHVDG